LRIVFSRKGFDTTSGGAPSPIIDGVPVSLPIPTRDYPSKSKYGDLSLGDALPRVKSNLTADSPCHEDPMFWDGRCAFGQTGAAQGLLENRRVGEGDVFLFFGLFGEPDDNDRHHRIFGYLRVDKRFDIGASGNGEDVWRRLKAKGAPRRHPHTIDNWDNGGKWHKNNAVYLGQGSKAKKACDILRLTKPGGPASYWCVPQCLRKAKLTQRAWRWLEDGTLRVVVGQEFVADIGDLPEPKKWLGEVIAAIETDE
jgi:hypothetical protein